MAVVEHDPAGAIAVVGYLEASARRPPADIQKVPQLSLKGLEKGRLDRVEDNPRLLAKAQVRPAAKGIGSRYDREELLPVALLEFASTEETAEKTQSLVSPTCPGPAGRLQIHVYLEP